MPKQKPNLDDLLKQEADIKTAIREAKKEQARQEAETFAERARIVGTAILAEMEKGQNTALADIVQPVIEARTIKARDRKLLGLQPRKKTTR